MDRINKKYDSEEGFKISKSLWQDYNKFDVDFNNSSILDFGCSWGYFCMHALNNGCSSAVGVDIVPHWEKVQDIDYSDFKNLDLFSGDLLNIEELKNRTFDIIVSSGTMFLLDSVQIDHVLEWFFSHLKDGGQALIRTRCVTARSFNDLGGKLSISGAQLLFSRKVINEFLTENSDKNIKNHINYTGSTWIMACHCAGFEVVDIRRGENTDVEKFISGHKDKISFIDKKEFSTGEITLHLQKTQANIRLLPFKK